MSSFPASWLFGTAAPTMAANGAFLHRPDMAYSAILPEIVLIGGALLLMLMSALSTRKMAMQWHAFYTVMVGLLAMASASSVWQAMAGKNPSSTFAGAIARDKFSLFFVIVIGVAVVLAALIGEPWLRSIRAEGPEYYILIMLSAAGGMLMAAANDLIVVFIGLEILSIALYVLAGMGRSGTSREAAMKYFVLGAFSSALFLYGIALIYGATGTTNLSGISQFLAQGTVIDSGLLLGGMVLLLVGFAFKVGAVPFHQWTPDVYQGSPTPVTGFMAAAAKAAGFAALLRIFGSTLMPLRLDWQPAILAIAILTLLVGSIVAVVQNNVKRMLAYSSINHAGFILLGLQAASRDGLNGSLYYLLAYSFMVMGSFAVVNVVAGGSDRDHELESYRGLASRRPSLALAFTVLLLAQAGVPLTAGFLAKFYVISALVENASYGTAIFAMLTAAIAAFFYLRLVTVMYSRPATAPAGIAAGIPSADVGGVAIAGADSAVVALPTSISVALVITVGFTIALGVLPSSVLNVSDFVRQATATLF